MDDQISPQRLNEITTLWTMVRQAHGSSPEDASEAQQILMERYSGAAYRYLLAALRDPDAAEEMFQEFALRFVRGDFRKADPDRGRFRDYVKTSLFHLILDYQEKRRRQGRMVPLDQCAEPQGMEGPAGDDQTFLESWRNEVLSRTWQALEAASREGSQPYYHVLRFRAENPTLTSAEMATQLSVELGREVKDTWVRQTIRRAREKFAQCLLDELACSLENPTREQLEEELTDLGLLPFCQEALDLLRA